MSKIVKKIGIGVGKNRFFQSLTGILGHELIPRKWVFIVGCYNSGTTLLHEILAECPNVASLPTEGAFLTNALYTPEEFGWVRMWHKCIDEVGLSKHNGDRRAVQTMKNWSVWLDRSRPVIIEKSISNTPRILYLQKYFKPSCFIYVVRNGYAVAEGIRRKANLKKWHTPIQSEQYPIKICAQQWIETDRMLDSVKGKVENLLLVKYEELVDDPDRITKKIYDFVGEHMGQCSDFTKKQYDVTGYHSEIVNMNQKSIARLSGEDIQQINLISTEILQKYEYEIL